MLLLSGFAVYSLWVDFSEIYDFSTVIGPVGVNGRYLPQIPPSGSIPEVVTHVSDHDVV